jgi:hypothetical protein
MVLRKIFYSAIVLTGLLVTSCEKPDYQAKANYIGPLKVNFNNYAGSFGIDLPLANADVNIPIEIKITNSVDPAPSDIKAKVLLDRNVLYDYNTDNGTAFILPPDSAFTFTPTKETTLIIPKGQRRAGFVAKINPSKLDLSKEYAVGFSIADAVGAEVNSGDVDAKVVVTFNLRNKYDGVYRVKYRLFHPTNAAITGNGTIAEWNLITSGANSVYWETATVMYNFTTGGITYFGSAAGPSLQVDMDVNQSNNNVTLRNVGSQATALGFPSLGLFSGVTNKYTPATKTFTAAYNWTPAGAGARERYDTLIYIRPR